MGAMLNLRKWAPVLPHGRNLPTMLVVEWLGQEVPRKSVLSGLSTGGTNTNSGTLGNMIGTVGTRGTDTNSGTLNSLLNPQVNVQQAGSANGNTVYNTGTLATLANPLGLDSSINSGNMQIGDVGTNARGAQASVVGFDGNGNPIDASGNIVWNVLNQTPDTTMGTGITANPTGGFNYNSFADPGFQFQLQQGQDAIARATANRGGLLAGSTLGALNNYSQDYANSAYNNAFNRYQAQVGDLSGLAGLGGQMGSQVANLGSNVAGAVSNNITGLANAQTAAQLSNQNNWMQAAGSLIPAVMQYAWMF